MTLTLTYDMQGGTPQIEPFSDEVMEGASAHAPLPMSGITKSGFKFHGWRVNGEDYTVESGVSAVDISTDTTAMALWNPVAIEDVTLAYDANGGKTTPDSQTETPSAAGEPVEFTLADAIERDEGADGRKYSFVGWEINGIVYDAGETVSVSTNTTAIAKWKGGSTTVSPKAYGYSPNGLKNALGTTRFHHQPGYPRPMGV